MELLDYNNWLNESESSERSQVIYFILDMGITKEDYLKTCEKIIKNLFEEQADDFSISNWKYINNSKNATMSTGDRTLLELNISSKGGNELLGEFEIGKPFKLDIDIYTQSLNSVPQVKLDKFKTGDQRLAYPVSVYRLFMDSYKMKQDFVQNFNLLKYKDKIEVKVKQDNLTIDEFKNKLILALSEDTFVSDHLKIENLGILISNIYFNENTQEQDKLITDLQSKLTALIRVLATIELIKTNNIEQKVIVLSEFKDQLKSVLAPYYDLNYDELSDAKLRELVFKKLKPDLLKVSSFIKNKEPERTIASNELIKFIMKIKPILNDRGIQLDESE